MTQSDTLTVGMVLPTPGPGAKRPAVAVASVRLKLAVFCGALEDDLSISKTDSVRVLPKTFDAYAPLLEAVSSRQVALAWLPPLLASRATAAGHVTPVAVPLRGEHAWYATALFSAVGSPYRSLGDLQGARVAWVDPKSMGGHVVMKAWLRSQGIAVEDCFAEQQYFGGHEQVVAAVLEGRADVGATFAHPDPQGDGLVSAGWGDASVQVIAVAGRIPSDVLAASPTLSSSQVGAVRDALTQDMNAKLRGAALALFEADQFAPADEAAMKSLAELVVHWDT
ncbi:MAG TPA: PhnD/SsuA/transferrin family substrate-binding protein [Polyangiaceae bacterium]|nr:MAG: ABC transporter, phosphonate, periplasmic substrate-binding protein [Deltaproteobacteria bacterium ADurb.Bin207]HNS98423.1 PhnD/SsuA/transferrin family substrate-binding protein [Polyangiaceae bacterium]HNZ22311.1 PhnD/SsuA/transferrin family substrate-binding protein [Polyangiaceae bacterium]HOD20845.1 PhnD/SsuA/transferrin family substrate-binding protein [Polyangiaceae bacterium]HOE49117.1 PhnD/SsuA/transferrin family substrate-binding protein [Polyangiaceae bacterium]